LKNLYKQKTIHECLIELRDSKGVTTKEKTMIIGVSN